MKNNITVSVFYFLFYNDSQNSILLHGLDLKMHLYIMNVCIDAKWVKIYIRPES